MTSSLSGQAALIVGSTSRTSAAHRAWQARRRSRELALASSRLYTVAVESCVGDLDMGPPCCQVTGHSVCGGAVHLGQALRTPIAVHLPATVALADHTIRPALANRVTAQPGLVGTVAQRALAVSLHVPAVHPHIHDTHWITFPLASSVARTTSSK